MNTNMLAFILGTLTGYLGFIKELLLSIIWKSDIVMSYDEECDKLVNVYRLCIVKKIKHFFASGVFKTYSESELQTFGFLSKEVFSLWVIHNGLLINLQRYVLDKQTSTTEYLFKIKYLRWQESKIYNTIDDLNNLYITLYPHKLQKRLLSFNKESNILFDKAIVTNYKIYIEDNYLEDLKYRINQLQDNILLNSKDNKNRRTKLGILLNGKPGTGKSLIARYLTQLVDKLNVGFLYLNLDNKEISDVEKFLEKAYLYTYGANITFIVLEDIDRIFNQDIAINKENTLISFSSLLSLFDSYEYSNTILIATCNDIDKVDPALKRPGRLDLILNVNELSDSKRKEFIYDNLSIVFDDEILEDVFKLTKGWTISLLNEFTNRCITKDNYKEVIQDLSERL